MPSFYGSSLCTIIGCHNQPAAELYGSANKLKVTLIDTIMRDSNSI
jgi:hypothetical protein